jgi:hypothetical protein
MMQPFNHERKDYGQRNETEEESQFPSNLGIRAERKGRAPARSLMSPSPAPSPRAKRMGFASATTRCSCSCSSPKALTPRLSICSQISRRRSDWANRNPLRLPRLAFRQASYSGRAQHLIGCLPSFPSAKVEGNAERCSFRVSHIVSKLDHSVHGMHIRLAVVVIFRFSLWMIRRNKTGSKLCASLTRHTTAGSLWLPYGGSTCKGASPRCIPRYRADEARRYA